MYATDFLFDGQRASDFGCMICSFDENAGTVSGGEIEYNTAKPPGSDRFSFYGTQSVSAATWNFSICKDPDKSSNPYFNQYEESRIMKWLVKTDGYRFLQFAQEGYEDIFYRVYFNVQPHQVFGRTAGFDLTMTSDCAYGFSDVITRNIHIQSYGQLMLDIRSDVNAYILPAVKISGAGNISIRNHNAPAGVAASFSDRDLIGKPVAVSIPLDSACTVGEILMDSSTEIITGLKSPGDFNWNFLKLADGKNFIEICTNTSLGTDPSTSLDIDIEIRYREPRYIRI